ncbi:hypothetical protein BYT27DRAFT_7254427 [Phlegmacium glaucopus]|nr:hypothetical protein BYT27DRAFT_7254427 [Phlegmacium glaucopus]
MSSGGDFEPAEESERGFDDVELEDNEPDTKLANKKSSGKKEKKGILARSHVHTIRDQVPDWQYEDNDQTPSCVKRKLDTDLFPHPHNKAANIKKPKRTIPSASLSSAASNSGGRCSASSPSVTTQSHSRSETSKPASVQPGGISSGKDEVEHHYVVNQTAVGMQYRSIVKIEEIEGALILTKRSNVKKSPTTKVRELNAWATLPDDKIAELWNEVFGDIYPVVISANAGDDNHLFTVIKKLVSVFFFRIACEAAVMALEDEYNCHEIFTVEDHAGFVINMLGNDNKTNMMIIIQVLCALTYSTTGKFQPPSGKTRSFLQDNWGDYKIQDGKGKLKLKQCSTLYQTWVNKMTEDHVFIAKQKAPVKQEESVEVEMDEEEEEEALYDPMFEV